VYFLKRNRALITNSKTERENKPHANSVTSDDNSCNKQTYVAAVIVGSAADAAYFITEKASLNINKISYIAS
jgi:hypothetical protein